MTDRSVVTNPSVQGEGAFLSIGGLSLATGVPIETLRTWEIRYGFPKAIRRPSGHRRFEIGVVARIRRMAAALRRGLKAGDVVPVSDEAIDALLVALPERQNRRTARAHLEPADLLAMIRAADTDGVVRYLRPEAAHADPVDYLRNRIAPAVELIGASWEKGEIDIVHEHFASERISDALRKVRTHFEDTARGPLVVLATLPGETHGLGLQMASVVFASRGLRMLLLGTEVPIEQIVSIAVQTGAIAIAISISRSTASQADVHAARLRALLPKGITLLLGGSGAPPRIKGAEVLRDFEALDTWATQTRALPARRPSRRRG